MHEWPKHRRHQMIVTVTIVTATIVSYILPHEMSHLGIAASVLSNMIWIWIE